MYCPFVENVCVHTILMHTHTYFMFFADSLVIRNVTVGSISDVSVTVTWVIPQDLLPLVDKILVTITARQYNITNLYPADAEAITINDLVPSLSYSISVVAIHNSSKISPPTTVKIIMPDCQGMNMHVYS